MKQFKAESKKVLDLMINSIYTNKDIFLRELISNASDAIDKAHFNSLTNSKGARDFKIAINIDKPNRTLTITDNGVGMDEKELEQNLGVIAKSGTEEFKKSLSSDSALEVIGQFGVGFYSSFMVADRVEVISKTQDGEAHRWTSCGVEGYTIEKCEDETKVGTTIILHIKENTSDYNYDKYLEEYEIKSLVKKYSNYIRYPIVLESRVKVSEKGEEEEELKSETLNSMTPIWKKQKSEITQTEYNEFYKNAFLDMTDPVHVLHYSVEGAVSFKALLYFPENVDYNYYSKDYEKGLQLYTNGVLITDKYSELLPDYFSFVKGVVDAELPLNVSRETLQSSRDVVVIANNIENRIKTELLNLLKDQREKYEKIYNKFGLQFKYCIYKEYGFNKEKLQDLLMFKSLKQDKMITFNEYVEALQDGQDKIYYIPAKSDIAAKTIPQVQTLLEGGKDVILATDNIDELVLKMINSYKDKQFINAMNEAAIKEDITLDDSDQKVIDFVKESLKDYSLDVKLTKVLKDSAASLSSEGEISLDMEKTLKAAPGGENIKANKVLQINADAPIYNKLKESVLNQSGDAGALCYVLYEQARLTCGLELEDAAKYTKTICELLTK